MLEATHLSKSFGALAVLTDVSLAVERGTVHGLIGPNGAGKTTLVNILTGHVRADSGSVSFDGTAIDRLPPHRRAHLGISRTFQAARLLEDLSTEANIRLGQQLLAKVDDKRFQEVVTLLGLEGDLHRPAGSLPAGKRRLVELARSLVGESRVLLLDEPFAGLTVAEITKVAQAIRGLARDLDLAVLLIEHNLTEVFALSDHVSVLDRGVIVAAGPPSEIAESSDVRRVFFGEDSTAPRAPEHGESGAQQGFALEVKDLQAGYGRMQVIHGVNLNIGRREVVGLVGVNGAGKSTLLRALSGHARVTRGTTRLKGAELKARSARELVRSGLSMVPEGRRLFTSLSAEENLRIAGLTAGLGERDIHQRIEQLLQYFPQIKQFRARAAGDLSGGQQQAVTIARALMSRPSVLLLDEPSIGLSTRALDDLAPQLLSLLHQEDISVLLVEQNLGFASRLCERSYLLDSGRIIAEGSMEKVRAAWDELNDEASHAQERVPAASSGA